VSRDRFLNLLSRVSRPVEPVSFVHRKKGENRRMELDTSVDERDRIENPAPKGLDDRSD
jgi:hypothetical protein